MDGSDWGDVLNLTCDVFDRMGLLCLAWAALDLGVMGRKTLSLPI